MKLPFLKGEMWLRHVLPSAKLCIIFIPVAALPIFIMFLFVDFNDYLDLYRNNYLLLARVMVIIRDAYIGCLIALPVTSLFVAIIAHDLKIFTKALMYTLIGLILLVTIIMPLTGWAMMAG